MRCSFLCVSLLLLACEKPAPREPEPSNTALLQTANEGSKGSAADPHGGNAHPSPHSGASPHGDPHAMGGAHDPHAMGGAHDPHAMGGNPHAPGAAPGGNADALNEPARAAGLTWEAPAPFVRRAPKSTMRVAEYGLEGEPQAELGVFYFGSDQGGSVEANMTRWVGQFTQPDGSATKPKRSERKVKGVDVSLIEARGTYSGGMAMPGAPAPGPQADAMLLGAIAKGPQGAVFFKLVGPRAALEKARPAFDGMISSLRTTEASAK